MMSKELIEKIISLILENTVNPKEAISEQIKSLIIMETELTDSRKYFTFDVDRSVGMADNSSFGTLSLKFGELTHGIFVDCILHFKEGYVHALEVYSCDGTPFEDLDLTNIGLGIPVASSDTRERKNLIRLLESFKEFQLIIATNYGLATAKRFTVQIIDYLEAVLTTEPEEYGVIIDAVAQKYGGLFIGKAGLSEFHIWHEDYETRHKANLEYEKVKKEIEKILGI